MSGSILNTIKVMLQIEENDPTFDMEIELHINGVFSQLYAIGASPIEGFEIDGAKTVWSDFLGGLKDVAQVKQYIYYNVKLAFDAPATSFGQELLQKQIAKLEWYLNTMELKFNPDAYVAGKKETEDPVTWTIDETKPTPKEIPKGAMMFDPKTQNMFRNI